MTLDFLFIAGVLLFKLHQLNIIECNFSIKRFPGRIVLLSPELTEIHNMHGTIFTNQENNIYYLTLILAKLCIKLILKLLSAIRTLAFQKSFKTGRQRKLTVYNVPA